MELTLSNNSPTNTVLVDYGGRPVYEISTPWKWGHKTTTIYKKVLDEHGQPTDTSVELARIRWRAFQNSRLIFEGKILDIGVFMPRGEFLGR